MAVSRVRIFIFALKTNDSFINIHTDASESLTTK